MFLLGGLAVVVAWLGARILAPVHIDARYSRFAECGEAFLQSVPMLPEYRLHYLKQRRHRQ
jgi:hypothetical protein